MTFRDIAYKMFRANIKRYLSYFFGVSFSIMVFFIYSTIMFDEEFSKTVNDTTITSIMALAMVIVGVFSVFFISFAHTSFVKSRNKEFGLFLSLGMTNKDISKMIRYENGMIGLLSLALGLVSGTIFSRLFFMIVVKILDLEAISFHLNIKSYLYTILLFILTFLIIIWISRRFTKKLEITELLKETRRVKYKNRSYPLLGFLGIILVIGSLVLFFFHLDGKIFPDKNSWMVIFLILTLIGLYLTISEFGSMLLGFVKKNQGSYYKNLLNITEVNRKYRMNTRIIFIISLLSAAVIFFIGIAFSLYSESLKIATEENPYHLSYVTDSSDSLETKNKIRDLINNANTEVMEEKTVNYIEGAVAKKYNGNDIMILVPAISEKVYEELMGIDLNLKTGESATLLLTAKPERNQWYTDSKLEYSIGKDKYNFNYVKELNGIPVNIMDSFTYMMVIINEEDYAKIEKEINAKFIRDIHLLNFTNWRDIKGLKGSIEDVLFTQQHQEKNNFYALKPKPSSRIDEFYSLKQEYGFVLFVMSFIGILFFVTAANVLYFKLINDIEDTRKKFNILSKIGIKTKEIKKIISKELKLIFYVPFGIGLILGYAFIYILMVNLSVRGDVLIDTSVIVAIYFTFQSIYYYLSRKKYVTEIIK